MGKMTFVVNFPDGQEPAVSAATDIFGGKLVSAAFKDLTEDNSWRSVTELMPPDDSDYVIVHNGDCTSIGRFIYDDWWDSDGGGFFSPVQHWIPLPEIDDSEGCQNV